MPKIIDKATNGDLKTGLGASLEKINAGTDDVAAFCGVSRSGGRLLLLVGLGILLLAFAFDATGASGP